MSLLTSAATRFVERVQNLRHTGCNEGRRAGEVAVGEDVRLARFLALDHDESRDGFGPIALQFCQPCVSFLEVLVVGLKSGIDDPPLLYRSVGKRNLERRSHAGFELFTVGWQERLLPLYPLADFGAEVAVELDLGFFE